MRPVDNIVKVLGVALVAAVLLLVFAMWRQGNALDDFTAQQRRSAAEATCRARVTGDVERIGTYSEIRGDNAVTGGLELLLLSFGLRADPPAGPEDPRLARSRVLQDEITDDAHAAHIYNGRLTQLAALRAGAAGACADNPDYQLPPSLLVLEP